MKRIKKISGTRLKLEAYLLSFTALVLTAVVTACMASAVEVADVPEATYPANNLGVVVDENSAVLHIEPGSAAEEADLQVGDTLIALDGVQFQPNPDEVKEIIRSREQAQLRVRRDGEEIEIEIVPAPPPPRPDMPTPTPVMPPQNYF